MEFGIFEHKPPVLLAWPCNKPFSALKKKKKKEKEKKKVLYAFIIT